MRALITSLATIAAPLAAEAYDEPAHIVEVDDGKIQIRAYAPMIVASVDVRADQERAPNAGFQPLGGYIFGDNRARGTIDMTVPVTQARSQKIDMTTPVTQAPARDGVWTVSFVMPEDFTMDTLPVPNDPSISLSERPAERVAAIRFNGGINAKRQARKQAELEAWIADNGYRAIGDASFAYYSPPWIPNAFRRNEVMIPVEKVVDASS
ncbi:MAG: heme-binding protein [Pseudomonadota bacterium]